MLSFVRRLFMTKTPMEYFNRWPKYFGPKAGAIDILIRYNDGKDDWRPSNGCCGHMRTITTEGIKSVYASLWCRNEELYDAACDYWDYLLGSSSPYRLALKDLERLYDDKGRPIAFGLHDMLAPLQVCISVMIQCRVPQEQVSKLRSYAYWRANGFTQPQAFYLSEHIYMFEDGRIQLVPPGAYHHGFEPHNDASRPLGGIDYRRLRDGTPDFAPGSWGTGQAHYSTPKMHYYMWTAPTSCIKDILAAPQEYTGKFSKAFRKLVSANGMFKTAGLCSRTAAVDILKKNLNLWAPND
jgi:hypothetical protein